MKKLLAVAAAAGLGLTGLGLGATSASATASGSRGDHPSSLAWHACSAAIVNGAKAFDGLSPVKVSEIIQCAELQVPLDFNHPNGQKITLELTKTPHQGAGEAKGDIVVNPGGPGAGGTTFGARVFAQSSAPMQAAYNVIGFDPRGVGFSTPKINCDPEFYNAPRPAYRVANRAEENAWRAKAKDYADKCAAKYGKGSAVNLLDHSKTIDWDHDVDAIRIALGREKLDYYGASYGTYLGQTYATLFPKHVGHMVLDGNVSPKAVWYPHQLLQDVQYNENLDYYFGWIARFDSTYHLGTTQKAVRDFYYGLENKLAKNAAVATIDGTTLAVGQDELNDGIGLAGSRRSQAVWHSLAVGLSAYKSGDMDTFVGSFGVPTTGGIDDNINSVYNAVECTDAAWPTSWAKWHADAVRIDRNSPFLSWNNVWFNASCFYWGAKPGTPVKVGATKDLPKNILMFNATDDAPTPYVGALELRKILGAHLVVQDGDRTHCIVHRGDKRPGGVDSFYDDYFLNDKLPQQNITHVSQLGDPTPPAASAAAARSKATPSFNDVIK